MNKEAFARGFFKAAADNGIPPELLYPLLAGTAGAGLGAVTSKKGDRLQNAATSGALSAGGTALLNTLLRTSKPSSGGLDGGSWGIPSTGKGDWGIP